MTGIIKRGSDEDVKFDLMNPEREGRWELETCLLTPPSPRGLFEEINWLSCPSNSNRVSSLSSVSRS